MVGNEDAVGKEDSNKKRREVRKKRGGLFSQDRKTLGKRNEKERKRETQKKIQKERGGEGTGVYKEGNLFSIPLRVAARDLNMPTRQFLSLYEENETS